MDKIFLDVTLLPYRSLSKEDLEILCLLFLLFFFSIGVYFWYLGAWPVFGFLGLDVFLLYYAFKINYKSGEIFETIKIIKEIFSLREIIHLEETNLEFRAVLDRVEFLSSSSSTQLGNKVKK